MTTRATLRPVHLHIARAPVAPRVDLFLARSGLSGAPIGPLRTRIRAILALEAQTDAELALIGIPRDGIVAHVFRDLTGG